MENLFMIICAIALPAMLSLSWVKLKGVEYITIHYRWIFVCIFLLPLSILYDGFMYLRNRLVFFLSSAPKQHDLRVRQVQKQVRDWNAGGRQNLMCTARPGWATMSFRQGLYKRSMTNIEVNLVDILEVDTDRKVVRAEPLVTMGQITACLNPLGWTLPVIPELDDLTVGGLIMGVGIETSSHIYGLMQHFCISYELVTADGSVIKCSKEENTDLFYAVPWSHGTLGFLVSAEMTIVPAKKFVRVKYIPLHSQAELVHSLKEASLDESNYFVEGIVYSPTEAVLMTGRMTNLAEEGKINRINQYWKPWFYRHVEGFLTSGSAVEYIPLRHYYHRHTRSIFWMLRDIIPFGNNALFRVLFGWSVPPKVSLLKLTMGQTVKQMYEKYQLIQDMLVPMDALGQSLDFFDQDLQMYPLWLCPAKLFHQPGLLQLSHGKDELYVDIGAYGTPLREGFSTVPSTRRLEDFVMKQNGFQMLYADSYLNREQFRQMFNHKLYDKMRQQLGCQGAFPEIYDKVNRQART